MEAVRRDSNGNALCRWCGTAVGGRRRTFCSDACVHEWRLRSSVSYLRECVFERDRGVCAVCRIDTVALRRRILRLPFGRRVIEMRALRITKGRKSWWEADHIVPVVEGGDSNLDNVRTLCVMCHKEATAQLRARRHAILESDGTLESRGRAPRGADARDSGDDAR
jgi:5-methylcytosine-specific restriction protein A